MTIAKPLILSQKKAGNVARENLISLGTCFGKFTKTRKFRLHITSLDFLAPYASYKLWLKASAEQQFLYGHNVTKSGLGRITENTDKYQVRNVLTNVLFIHFLFKKMISRAFGSHFRKVDRSEMLFERK